MRHAPTVLFAAMSLAACAGTTVAGDAPSDAPPDPQHSTAVLFVERQASDVAGTVTHHVGARFVQYTGITADTLPDLVGMPAVRGAQGCQERVEAALDTASTRAEARLLDVGPIEVRAGDRTMTLEPRRFPDLWNVISGVIYAGDDELPSADWHFSAPGSDASHVSAFDVDARAPDALGQLVIAEQAITPSATVTVPHRAFTVRWAAGDAGDTVFVAFESAGDERPVTIACAARDEGSLEIDSAWADRVADLAHAGATVSVHRVRTRAFALPPLENAQVVFDLSVRARTASE